MRSPLLLVVFLALAPSARAVPGAGPQAAQPGPDSPADWRRDVTDERVKAALLSKGWRLEDDGKALDPKTKAPVTKAVLDKAVLDLVQDARRAALETVNLMYAPGYQPDITDAARKQTLASELPPGLAAAILDPNSDPAKVRAMANAELDKVASYFDGVRTMADRQAGAQPVAAVPLGPRVNLPYFNASEQAAGEKLRSAAQTQIARDPFGRKVLDRLKDSSGVVELPAMLIEDQQPGVVAQYDFRRRAVVIDRASALDSVVGTVPPRERAALRQKLSGRAALLDYIEKHPAAAAAVAKDNDTLFVHELTHAWQDRRDPVFREMARGNIPDAQILEYEEEAYKTQNLFVRSKLDNDPASVSLEKDMPDFMLMVHGEGSWTRKKKMDLADASPSRALPLESVRAVQKARLGRATDKPASTAEETRAKSLDMTALTRADRELADLEARHALRMKTLNAEISGRQADDYKLMGKYYLGRALTAERSTDRSVWLDKAEIYAKASRDAALIELVREAKKNK